MSPCRICRKRTFALGFTTRTMWKGCARSARRPSNAPYSSNMSNALWVRTANIAGSWSATILCSMIREGSSDGMRPRSTSRTENGLKKRYSQPNAILNQIINTIPTHIYVLNTEGSVQYVNQAVMDYTGLSLEDVKQEDYRDRVIHPEDFKRVRAGRAASLRRGAPFSTEQRVLGNDGQYRWFLVRYKPLLDEQGRIVRWYVAAFDIEDRKRAEAQRDRTIEELQAQQSLLSESEQRFRTIFDEAGAGIALVDLQHPDTPIQTNRALQTMLSLTQEELGFPETFHELTASRTAKPMPLPIESYAKANATVSALKNILCFKTAAQCLRM